MAERGVSVRFIGQMRRPSGVGDETQVSYQDGDTVDAVLARLGYRPTERRMLRVLIEDQPARPREPVVPGATLVVFLPIGGG